MLDIYLTGIFGFMSNANWMVSIQFLSTCWCPSCLPEADTLSSAVVSRKRVRAVVTRLVHTSTPKAQGSAMGLANASGNPDGQSACCCHRHPIVVVVVGGGGGGDCGDC